MPVLDRIARNDWLLAAKVSLMLAIGALLTLVVSIVVTAAMRDSITVPIELSDLAARDLPQGTTAGDATVDARLDSATWGQAALYALTRLPAVAVLIWTFVLLLRVVNDARRADPFHRATVRRLRTIGLVLMVAGSLSEPVQFAAAVALSRTVDGGSTVGTLVFNAVWIFAGVAALAIAEVVNRGVALRDELDTVI